MVYPQQQTGAAGHLPHQPRARRAALALGLTLLAILQAGAARAEGLPGFGLNRSRAVVMADGSKGTQVAALNNSDATYLVENRIYPANGLTGYPQAAPGAAGVAGAPAPLIVTPPLRRLGPQARLPLRLLVTPGNALPTDRESLFFLSSKAIPSVPPRQAGAGGADGPRVVMALQQFIKLYYRPAGLKPHAIFDGDVAGQLQVRLAGGRLRVTNPTPYHIAFGVLSVGGKPVASEALRVLTPPKGEQDYPLPAGAGHAGERVTWRVIDEFGLVTDLQTQVLR
ncbi:molecular chaperone [Serratia marcescens]|uniref:Molecular chaperone n=1 Tax=Serratia marcescens TaxID=615 RepID=A0A5C7BM43_SERMA|nr:MULTISPECIES: molecular chaperone [Serratia]TXE24477.1 molecular chaperone [Serratia marcescens]TXE53313.1 molecular chaperone [Serratia marcescens]